MSRFLITPSRLVEHISAGDASVDLSTMLVVYPVNKDKSAFFGFKTIHELEGKPRKHQQGVMYKKGAWGFSRYDDHTIARDGSVTDVPSKSAALIGKDELLFCAKGLYQQLTGVQTAISGLKSTAHTTKPVNIATRAMTFADIKPLLDAMRASTHRIYLTLKDFPMTPALQNALVDLAACKGAKLTLELNSGLDDILSAAETLRRSERLAKDRLAAGTKAFAEQVRVEAEKLQKAIADRDSEIQRLNAEKVKLRKTIVAQSLTIETLVKENQASIVKSTVTPVAPVAQSSTLVFVSPPVTLSLSQFKSKQAQAVQKPLVDVAREEKALSDGALSEPATPHSGNRSESEGCADWESLPEEEFMERKSASPT